MLNLERERGKAKESALKEDMETRLIVEAGVALGTIRLGDYNTLKRAMYDPPRRAKRRAAPAAGKSILPAERHCPARGEPLPGVSEPTSPATGANPNGEIGK